MPSLVIIELNAFYDVKIDSDVILCNVQKPWCILCILWYVESVCCNHGDVRNRCVCGIHCCTFLIVISVLHITQYIDLVGFFFFYVKLVIYLKQSCFFSFFYLSKKLNQLFDQHLFRICCCCFLWYQLEIFFCGTVWYLHLCI